MINQDFSEYPEHRVGFFKLLRSINLTCFPGVLLIDVIYESFADTVPTPIALLELPPAQFKMLMDSIVWAFKHTARDIADTGLNCTLQFCAGMFLCSAWFHTVCLEVINNFAVATKDISGAFFQQYFASITQDVLYVLTDADHKSGFRLQCVLLARLFQLVEMNEVQAPLFDPATVSDSNMSNSKFLREYTLELLKTAFPHMQPYVNCFGDA